MTLRDFIIPLTKEVQVLYLLQRLGGPSISYLGPQGTFSHQAALKFFHNATSSVQELQLIETKDINEVFVNVLSNKTTYGVVPIENSQTGIVRPHLDLLISSEVVSCAETFLPIGFSLLSNSKLENIKKIYSHPQVSCCQTNVRLLHNAVNGFKDIFPLRN